MSGIQGQGQEFKLFMYNVYERWPFKFIFGRKWDITAFIYIKPIYFGIKSRWDFVKVLLMNNISEKICR